MIGMWLNWATLVSIPSSCWPWTLGSHYCAACLRFHIVTMSLPILTSSFKTYWRSNIFMSKHKQWLVFAPLPKRRLCLFVLTCEDFSGRSLIQKSVLSVPGCDRRCNFRKLLYLASLSSIPICQIGIITFFVKWFWTYREEKKNASYTRDTVYFCYVLNFVP